MLTCCPADRLYKVGPYDSRTVRSRTVRCKESRSTTVERQQDSKKKEGQCESYRITSVSFDAYTSKINCEFYDLDR